MVHEISKKERKQYNKDLKKEMKVSDIDNMGLTLDAMKEVISYECSDFEVDQVRQIIKKGLEITNALEDKKDSEKTIKEVEVLARRLIEKIVQPGEYGVYMASNHNKEVVEYVIDQKLFNEIYDQTKKDNLPKPIGYVKAKKSMIDDMFHK